MAPVSPEAWTMYLLKRLSPRLLRWVNRRISADFDRRLDKLGIPLRSASRGQ